MKADLTAGLVWSLVDYDPETGVFTWKDGARAGRTVGTVDMYGYLCARVAGKHVRLHRLAWLFVTGSWPDTLIDHIDGNRQNNRFANLRQADQSGNQQNRARPNRNRSSAGPLGAHFNKASGKWVAQISVRGQRTTLGYFATADEAGAAYLEAKKRVHPFSGSAAA